MVRSRVTGGRFWGGTGVSILAQDLPDGLNKKSFLSILRKQDKSPEDKQLMMQVLANSAARKKRATKGSVETFASGKRVKLHRENLKNRMRALEKRMARGEAVSDFQKGQIAQARKVRARKQRDAVREIDGGKMAVVVRSGERLGSGKQSARSKTISSQKMNSMIDRAEDKAWLDKKMKSFDNPRAAAREDKTGFARYAKKAVRKSPLTQSEIVAAEAKRVGVKPSEFGGVGKAWIERRKTGKNWKKIEDIAYRRRQAEFAKSDKSFADWAKLQSKLERLAYKEGDTGLSRKERGQWNKVAEELNFPMRYKKSYVD